MELVPSLAKNNTEFAAWRQELHQHPQTAYEEVYASDFVAKKLSNWGIEIHRGLGGTGVVGTLKGKKPGKHVIGLRADMDALNMDEQTNKSYCSKIPGKMHACGHDGHTTMLLAAAKHLAETRDFAGTVHFIFQPAEECAGGAQKMIDDGLFRKFPCDSIFGLHNWPDLPLGQAAMCKGPMWANADEFSITISGRGAHGAMPHLSIDPVLCGAQLVTALQSVVSRNIHPLDCGVVSVTIFQAGTASNVIPETVELRGTVRSFKDDVRKTIIASMKRVTENICTAFGARVEKFSYEPLIVATVNTEKETDFCADVLGGVLGQQNVDANCMPTMAAEDFGSMLQHVPGCYIVLGTADPEHQAKLHSPHYDFNDKAIPIGASYFVRVVEKALAA